MVRRRGTSLLEIMLVTVILAALVGLALMAAPHGRSQADTRGLAEGLAGRLSGAREQAMRLGEPVGLAFPSQDGALGHSGGCYKLRGFGRARRVEHWSFSSEFPDTHVFAGFWPGGASVERLDRQRDCAGSGLDLTTWGRPDPRDPVIVFLPNGSALSSQPLVDGHYRLVVCQALSSSPGNALGRATHLLARVQAPVTLNVSPEGKVSVTSGLVPQGGVELVTQNLGSPPGAPADLLTAGPNGDPVLEGAVAVEPAPVTGLPGGVDATVGADSHLSLIVRASDPDGDRLTCAWSAAGPGGEPSGSFSHGSSHRMLWDETAGHWLSRWEWVPPPGAEGKLYTLSCQVRDERGASISARIGAGGNVLVVPRGRIAFQAGSGTDIGVVNADGSDRTLLTRGRHAAVCNPEFSPDGSKLVFLTWLGGAPNNNRAIVMDSDGRNEIEIASGPIVGASWTPDGTQLIYTTFQASPRQLDYYVTRLGDHDPGPAPPPVHVGTLPYSALAPDPDVRGSNASRSMQASWVPSSDRRFLASFPQNFGGGWRWELAEVLVDAGGVTFFGIEADAPRLNSAGDRILYLDDTGLRAASAPYSAPTPGVAGTLGAQTNLGVSFGVDLGQPSWSPDGTQVVLDEGGRLHLCDSAGNNLRSLDLVPGGMTSASWTL